MILLHHIIQILHLADGDGRAVLRIIAFDGGFMSVTAVDGNVSGSPLRRIAFFRNRSAASVSRCSVSRKSMV
jgi:hypothetical protein